MYKGLLLAGICDYFYLRSKLTLYKWVFSASIQRPRRIRNWTIASLTRETSLFLLNPHKIFKHVWLWYWWGLDRRWRKYVNTNRHNRIDKYKVRVLELNSSLAHWTYKPRGRGTQKSFILRGSAPRSNPLPFYIPIFDRKCTPFIYLLLTNDTPFTFLV